MVGSVTVIVLFCALLRSKDAWSKLSGKSTVSLYTSFGFHLQNSLQISNCSHIIAGHSLPSQLERKNIIEEDTCFESL